MLLFWECLGTEKAIWFVKYGHLLWLWCSYNVFHPIYLKNIVEWHILDIGDRGRALFVSIPSLDNTNPNCVRMREIFVFSAGAISARCLFWIQNFKPLPDLEPAFEQGGQALGLCCWLWGTVLLRKMNSRSYESKLSAWWCLRPVSQRDEEDNNKCKSWQQASNTHKWLDTPSVKMDF